MSVRPTDPWTSDHADGSVRGVAATQRELILAVYRTNPNGLTDEEAADIAGVRGCWWKRCSELRQQGMIFDTGRVRAGSAGRPRIICAIHTVRTLFPMGGIK